MGHGVAGSSQNLFFAKALGELHIWFCSFVIWKCSDFPICAGQINRWRIRGENRDRLRESPFFVPKEDSPSFNQLFAGLYDLIFSKLTRTAHLVPTTDRNIRTIFAEKVHGHDNLEIVNSKTIAYLKWLIYIAAFKDEKFRCLIDDSQFYVAQCKTLEAAENNFWKEDLLDELETWYQAHPPTSKKRKSTLQNEFTNVEIDVFPRRVRALDALAAAAAPAAGNDGDWWFGIKYTYGT